MTKLFIEAESFKNLGGWVVDQQSMHVMGSSYVMAHGMGEPVPDATTFVNLPESGRYRAFVRTRDWTKVWGRGSAAGLFKLKADEKYFENTLGNNGESWDWQFAGELELAKGKCKLSLCDLTGFNGRCDAIYLTNEGDMPQNTEEFRRKASRIVVEEDENEYDLIVVGGGIAGTCLALTAIREGLNVCLIQDRPVLGGCNSSEIKVGLGGFVRSKPYENLGNVVEHIAPVFGSPGSFADHVYEDDRKVNAFLTAKRWAGGRYTLSLCERVIELEKMGDRIVSVTTKNIFTGKMKTYRGSLFADCSGDGTLARLSGCDMMYGREARSEFGEQMAPDTADNQVMGMTITWHSGDDPVEENCAFADIDWGIEFDEERSYKVLSGDWEWEVGQYRDMADETEYIRDYSLMTIFGNWSFLKNRYSKKEEYRNKYLKWVSPLGGKRESWRVKGDHVLTENDIEGHVPYDDGTACLTWDIDIHYPDPLNEKLFPEPFRSCAIHRGIFEHYPVPYRCLYSKDINNLFLGGRIVSTTHVAFACVRVMRTLGALGEVAGLAAGICKRENCSPREVYEKHLDELKALMTRGVVINPYHAYPPGTYEHLAFPECNKFYTHPNPALPLDDKERMWRINNMGANYLTKDRFEGIENREELTDEEKEITKRFYDLIKESKFG